MCLKVLAWAELECLYFFVCFLFLIKGYRCIFLQAFYWPWNCINDHYGLLVIYLGRGLLSLSLLCQLCIGIIYCISYLFNPNSVLTCTQLPASLAKYVDPFLDYELNACFSFIACSFSTWVGFLLSSFVAL